MAVVPVPDPRLAVLTEMERSKKTVAAQVRFVDVPGGVSSAQGIAKLREVEALAVVIRSLRRRRGARPRSSRPFAATCCSPTSSSWTRRCTRRRSARRASRRRRSRRLQAAHAALEAETPLRDAKLDPEVVAELRGIAPLTLKPEVVVANLEEGTEVPPALGGGRRGRRVRVDRGRDGRDGRRRGARAARGVRGGRARAREGDRGVLPSDRPHHVPHDRRGRDAGVGGPPRRGRAGGRPA